MLVRILENFSHQSTESTRCWNNLPVQRFPSHYIHGVCTHGTHTRIHVHVCTWVAFICTKRELHKTLLCENRESSPQIELNDIPTEDGDKRVHPQRVKPFRNRGLASLPCPTWGLGDTWGRGRLCSMRVQSWWGLNGPGMPIWVQK